MPTDSIQTPGSSNIASADYDDETQLLAVTFKAGGTWEYENVSPETWDGFKGASSKGEFLHRQIKGRYGTRRV